MSPGASLTAKILGRGAIETTANGATITLSDGSQVLDFGSYGITLLGHRHPAVLAALSQALETMPTASRVLANPNTAAFAAELADRCGGPLRRVWLGSDGSDAVEVSLKLARRGTERMRILVAEGAFHGKTLGALALTSNPMFRAGLEPLLGSVSQLPRDDPEAVRRETQRGDVAALVFEPIQGEGGVRVLERHVLARWTADAHTAGAFVVSDEIQVGLGRCGPFSPSIAADLKPDAVLFGKALGGGLLPLSAMVATDSFAAPLISDPTWHTTTFSGHPLSCAAGVATLGALEDLSAQANAVGEIIGAGLDRLACERPELIVEIRGEGLIWGIEFATPGAAGAALIEFAQSGLLVSPCLSSNTTVRLLPPMVTTREQAEKALEIVAETLPSLTGYV
ncbi:MAG: aspartate aminotransferase family protein [Solirubrobacterales bacterium]